MWASPPAVFADLIPHDAQAIVDEIAQERADIDKDPARWCEAKVGLTSVDVNHNTETTESILTLGFLKTDHAISTVMERWWTANVSSERLRGMDDNDLMRVVPGMSHSFGLNATVQTADNQIILVQRSARISSERNRLHISVNEGMRPDDIDQFGQPDLVTALLRGITEELGVTEISRDRILLHSLVLDASRYQWGFLGHVDLRGTEYDAEFFIRSRRGLATDWWENARLQPIPATPKGIRDALGAPDQWVAHGWLNLLLSGVCMFPRSGHEFLGLLPK